MSNRAGICKLNSKHVNQSWLIKRVSLMLNLLQNLFGGKPKNPAIATVEIYTWQLCPYCIRAKFLLNWKQSAFTEYKIDGDNTARIAMAERANGRKSVPQIFINGTHIGGCDELYALDRQGKLDPLLEVAAAD